MTDRREKAESTPRKRALVSCDRCKLRRARCIRSNPDEPCADCTLSGVQCESKLPRKQRVYGSVETLSLRFRALESLVKGLFPGEEIQDTNTLFKLAAARNIPMPPPDDLSPADIFNQQQQQQQQPPLSLAQTIGYTPSVVVPSPASTTSPNPFLDAPPKPPPEKLIPTLHGVPHYFGPSSSFKLATTIRSLVAQCNAIPEARSLLRHLSASELASSQGSKTVERSLPRTSSGPSDEELPLQDQRHPPNYEPRGHKRARVEPDLYEARAPAKEQNQGTMGGFLPPRSVADALVSAYFEHVHTILPLFQRSHFQLRYEATFSRKSESIRESEDTGWLCCLALVFAFGAQALEKHDPEQARSMQKKYLGFVRSFFRQLVTTTSLVNVQALVLLQLYDHNVGKRNSSWVLIGVAARMAISMGIHREGPNAEFDPIERNTRRLVWWSLYIFEKILCIILGRPSSIDDSEMSTQIPDETMLENKAMPPDFMSKAFELAKNSYQARKKAYWVDGSPEERTPPIAVVRELLQELDGWHKALPAHLQPDAASTPHKQKRSILLLHVYYCYTRCILSRNYLIQKVERNISRFEKRPMPPSDNLEQAVALSEDCIVSAHKSLQYLNIAADLGFLNGVSWIDVFYVFHAVLIICADFLARPKDQLESPQDIDRKAAVRAILRSTRTLKLAPTYNILSQIAIQFASITGATNEPYASYLVPNQSSLLSPTPQPAPFVSHGLSQSLVDVSDVTQDWFENEPANIPWNFFDLSLPSAAVTMPTTYPGYYMDLPLTSEADEWTARTFERDA